MKQFYLKNNQDLSVRFKKFNKKSYSAFNSLHRVISIGVLSSFTLFCANAKISNLNYSDVAFSDIQKYSENDDTYVDLDTIVNNNLDEVIVTSNRSIVPLKQTAKQVLIISSDKIKQLPVQSLQDLLNYVAGIDVQQRGGHGVQADISIRGGSFDQTAILLNGINLSNPQTGHFSLDLPINLSDIKQIEIIYGPSSFTYGASAFAGGINIITNTEPTHTLITKLDVGTHNLFNFEGNTALKTQNTFNQLSIGHNQSDGYISNSDYRISHILWQTQVNLNQSKINFQAGYNTKHYGANTFYSAAYPNQYDKTDAFFTSLKGTFGNKLKFVPAIYWSRHTDEFELFRSNTPNIPSWYTRPNNHRTDVYGANLNLQYKTGYGITNFATEIRNEGVISNVLGKERLKLSEKYPKSDNRTNISYIVDHTLLFNKTTISVGLLLNYNSSLEKHYKLYPNINVSHWLTEDVKLYSSWSKAFRMPTFTDLYYTTVTHIGNSKLKQENSESLELGILYRTSVIETTMTAYWMKGKNLIDWVKENPDDKWESKNLTKINKLGIDLGASFYINEIYPSLKNTILQINYTRLHQKRNTGNLTSNNVLNYLRDKLNVNLNYSIYTNLSISYNFRWQKRMGTYLKYEDLKPTAQVPYSPFCLSDLKINYKLNKFNIHLDLNNIFDKKYYDIGNIPQAGFWLIGGVSYILR